MIKMVTAQADYSIGQDRSWEKTIRLFAPGTSSWLIIPEKIGGITVTISFTDGASGKVQTASDQNLTINAGEEIAVNWPFGVVNNLTAKRLNPVSAVRIVQINPGTMKMTLRAQ